MNLETIYIATMAVLSLITMVGIPGPLLVALGALFYGLQTSFYTITPLQISIFIILGLVGIIIDNVFALIGAKKFGASKFGIIGAFIGMLGIFVIGPFGVIVGPMLGAFVGELLFNKAEGTNPFRAAIGALLGFITGIMAKVTIAISLVIWFATIVL